MKLLHQVDFKYTDNPYIDLLVYNLKILTLNCIVKDEERASKYESVESARAGANMIAYMNGWNNSQFENGFSYDLSVYTEYNNYYRMLWGLPKLFSMEELSRYNSTKEEPVSLSTLNASTYILLDQYQYLVPSTVLLDLEGKYLHEYHEDNATIAILESCGIIDQIKKDYTGPDYEYVNHVGVRSVNPYIARTAKKYELLYTPTIEFKEIQDKFNKYYSRNRVFTINNFCSNAYSIGSLDYDKFIIILILIQTMVDMISEVQEYVINKDIFDSRTIRYLFESYGVEYYKEIPVRYQIALIKNMNTLIKYKSTYKNIVDISNLFGFPDIKVFTYYIAKVKKVDRNNFKYYTANDINPTFYPNKDAVVYTSKLVNNRYWCRVRVTWGSYVYKWIDRGIAESDKNYTSGVNFYIDLTDNIPLYNDAFDLDDDIVTENDIGKENYKENYDVVFIKVPINDQNVSKYLKNKSNRKSYDYITKNDPFWDGVNSTDIMTDEEIKMHHEYKRSEILKQEFSAERTKYISIDASLDLVEYSNQISYFFNMIFDKHFDEDKLMLDVDPNMCESGKTKVRLSDILILSIALGYLYNGVEPNIVTTDMDCNLEVNGFDFDSSWLEIYNDSGNVQNSIEWKLNNTIMRNDMNGHKVFAGRFGSLTEPEADENVDEHPSYTVGAFLSGRYKVCTCNISEDGATDITTYDEYIDEESGDIVLPDAYESFIWERMQHYYEYDLIGAYFPSTINFDTNPMEQAAYIWSNEGFQHLEYPGYLHIPLVTGLFPMSHVNISGRFDSFIIPVINNTSRDDIPEFVQVYIYDGQLYIEYTETYTKENNFILYDTVTDNNYILKLYISEDTYIDNNPSDLGGKLYLFPYEPESGKDIVYKDMLIKDYMTNDRYVVYVYNERLYITKSTILKYHMIDISWDTPYDPEQNSHGDFINTNLLDQLPADADDAERFKLLKKIYNTNTNLRKHLEYMMSNAQSKRMFDIYHTIYTSMMETKISNDFYAIYDDQGTAIFEIGGATYKYLYGSIEPNHPYGVFYNISDDTDTYDAKNVGTDTDPIYEPDATSYKKKIAKDYMEYMFSRDYDLYVVLITAYNGLGSEDNTREYIMKITDYITYALEKYFSTSEWKYLYDVLPGNNIELIQRCIKKMVNFFRSWKTQILDENIIFTIDSKYENQVRILEEMIYKGKYNLNEKPSPKDCINSIYQRRNSYDKVNIEERVTFKIGGI